jgi:hypothetical protein
LRLGVLFTGKLQAKRSGPNWTRGKTICVLTPPRKIVRLGVPRSLGVVSPGRRKRLGSVGPGGSRQAGRGGSQLAEAADLGGRVPVGSGAGLGGPRRIGGTVPGRERPLGWTYPGAYGQSAPEETSLWGGGAYARTARTARAPGPSRRWPGPLGQALQAEAKRRLKSS